mmetsp:Transcript_36170/g.102258  ORF Transcript_36170/g.102258 Transcript_36170/m.102258 type:complete len:123 (+) Transcript_36170:372-740(+)
MSHSSWYWSGSGEELQQRWRRVASTHDLKDLAEDQGASGGAPEQSWKTACWGVALLAFSAASLALGLFSILVSKVLPEFDNPTLKAIQADRYYCLLIPLTIPATIIAVTINWMSMKLFKHNS